MTLALDMGAFMGNFFELLFGPNRFQPDSTAKTAKMDASQETLANIVAVIAFGLPVILLVGAKGFDEYFHRSISAFYYSPFLGGVFVGCVSIIAALLLAYGGQGKNEWRLASLGAGLAIIVAWMPTSGPERISDESRFRAFLQLSPSNGQEITFILSAISALIHLLAAAAFFLFLAYFSAYVFTREITPYHRDNGQLKPSKKWRNKIYKGCGLVIASCVAILIVYFIIREIFDDFELWDKLKLTFVFESVALWAFGFSWLVKGRVFGRYLLDT